MIKKVISIFLVTISFLVLVSCNKNNKVFNLIEKELSNIYQEGDSSLSVTKDLVFIQIPKSYPEAQINWNSLDEDVVSNMGSLREVLVDTNVTIVLTIVYKKETRYVEFKVVVKASEPLKSFYKLTLPSNVESNIMDLEAIKENTEVILNIQIPDEHELEYFRVNGLDVNIENNRFVFNIIKDTIIELKFIKIYNYLEGSFIEDFETTDLEDQYHDGSFIGINNSSWRYIHARNEDTYEIDNNGILLRTANEPSSLSVEILNGISGFSFEYKKAYTAEKVRNIEVLVNGTRYIANDSLLETGKLNKYIYDGPKIEGKVLIEIKLFGSGSQQVVIDNFKWTTSNTKPLELVKHNLTLTDTVSATHEGLIDENTLVTLTVSIPNGMKINTLRVNNRLITLNDLNQYSFKINEDSVIEVKYGFITYADVTNEEELIEAINNVNIKNINLKKDINLTKPLIIENRKDINIIGKSFTISSTDFELDYIIKIINSTNINLENLKLDGGKSALLVNNSVVDLSYIKLFNNSISGIDILDDNNSKIVPKLTLYGNFTIDSYLIPVVTIRNSIKDNNYLDPIKEFNSVIKDNDLLFFFKEG